MRDSIRAIWIIFGFIILLIVVLGAFPFMGWIDCPGQEELQASEKYFSSFMIISLGCLMASLLPSIFFFITRGDWRIDDTGVSFNSIRGSEVSLKWEEIERVKWQETDAILKGSEKKISFPWQLFEKPVREEARTLLQDRLKPHFDIYLDEHRVFSFEPNFRSVTKWMAKIIALIVIGLFPLLGWFVIFYPYDSLPAWAEWIGLAGMCWSVFMPIIHVLHSNRTQLRKMHGWHLRKNVVAED